MWVLASLIAVAQAGEVLVALDTPVAVYTDGRIMEMENGAAIARDLSAGRHLVQVRNLVGQIVAEMNLDVPVDQQVRLRYGARQLSMIGSGAIPFEAAPPPPPPTPATPVPTAQPTQVTTTTVTMSAPVGQGSLELAGLDGKSGAVWVDAVRLSYDANLDGFPAPGLSAGMHDVRIEKDRRVAYKGALEVRAGQNQRCLLELRGREYGLDCFFAVPALGGGVATTVASTSVGGLSVSVEGAAMPPPPVPPTPPVSTAPVTVDLVLKDPMDMCNVYVDGERVAEFRTGDRKRSVSLTPGQHTIEIKDFTEFESWHKGTLTVSGPDAMKVGFGEDETVEVYNRANAWRGQ